MSMAQSQPPKRRRRRGVILTVQGLEKTLEQTLDLAHRHHLHWSREQVEKLLSFVGGNPYLIRLALYNIWHEDITLQELLTISPLSEDNIYRNHLTRQLLTLQQQNEGLAEAFAKVVMSPNPVELELIKAFQLQSLGLVRFYPQGNTVHSSCELYTRYFQAYFADKNKS
ncbi:AAA-like domain-containing protein [Gloeothece citriformis]|uniref:AAA-like domain-containing protein n=1 Tax=Gloeothece citriformis TaxID=2546356 RepID=UPI000173BD06|nr:AAA-like domain-containing protein [Gloeothece citriformis]